MSERETDAALTGRWRKSIWRPFMSAVREYALVSEGDRIAVCVSGDKDSMLLAKCMQALQRRSPLRFDLRFLCMDPGYAPEHRAKIEENARLLEIPLEFFKTDVFEAVSDMDCNPCYMCAKMRRGYLYRRAQAMGCNKIALGHHFDDAVETLVMSMLFSGQLRGMRPRLKSASVPGMELIRPLYKVREAHIVKWRDATGLNFPGCICRLSGAQPDARRQQVKALVRQFDAITPNASRNIFRSGHNAMLDHLNGWKQGGITHTLLEEFEDERDDK